MTLKNCLLASAVTFFAVFSGPHAQQTAATVSSATPSPKLAGIAHIALRVHDLDALVAFYEKLGFVKAFALSRDGAVYEAFIKINDHQFIELYPVTTKDPKTGFLHVCFEGDSLQSVHDYYVTEGLTQTDVRKAGAGNLLFTMPGPETPTGPQNMDYTQYMPGSLHSKDFGLHLGPDRIGERIVSTDIGFNDPPAAALFYSEKAGFRQLKPGAPAIGSSYSIAGSTEQSIRIESDRIGPIARIALSSHREWSARELRKRGLSFRLRKTAFVLTDPDANEIIVNRP